MHFRAVPINTYIDCNYVTNTSIGFELGKAFTLGFYAFKLGKNQGQAGK